MAQFASAFGQRRQHRVSMGNGFIAGQVQSANQMLRGLNGLFFHPKILARCQSSFRARPIHAKSEAFSCSFSPSFTAFSASYLLYSRPVCREALPVPCAEIQLLRNAYYWVRRIVMSARSTFIHLAAKAGIL